MATNETRTRWTWAEFCRLPSEGSTRYEVIDGELYVTPGPAPRHQRVVTELIAALHPFVGRHELGRLLAGPVDVIFAEGDYLEPDLIFVGRDELELVSDRGIEGPPDLVVEVLSPSTSGRDRGLKRDRYRLYGVPEYWIVDPAERTVAVWRFGEGADEPLGLGPGDVLEWAPGGPGGPVLSLAVDDLLPGD